MIRATIVPRVIRIIPKGTGRQAVKMGGKGTGMEAFDKEHNPDPMPNNPTSLGTRRRDTDSPTPSPPFRLGDQRSGSELWGPVGPPMLAPDELVPNPNRPVDSDAVRASAMHLEAEQVPSTASRARPKLPQRLGHSHARHETRRGKPSQRTCVSLEAETRLPTHKVRSRQSSVPRFSLPPSLPHLRRRDMCAA